MSDLQPTSVPATPPPPRAPKWPIVLTLALVAAVAGGLYWMKTRPAPAAPTPLEAPSSAVTPTKVDPTSMNEAAAEASWRSAVSGLSSDPDYRAWIEQPGLLRRLVSAVVNVADGESPRDLLGFLAPKGAFQVVKREGRLWIDPKSYARYDDVARVLGTIDASAVGAAYVKVAPYVEAIYSEMAPPGRTFRATLSSAVSRLAAVPIVDGDVQVVEEGVRYLFADPTVEVRTAAEKHLLRMGPENARKIQAQLAAFDAAISR